MANRNPLLNGITDLLILDILSVEDSYAYEIEKKIQELSNQELTIPLNTVYTAIYKLEREGYITEYSKLVGRKRTRIYYHLEESGVSYVSELLESYQSLTTSVLATLDAIKNTKENSNA